MFLEGKGEAWQNWTRVRGKEVPPGEGVALGEVEPHLKSRGGREEACLGMGREEDCLCQAEDCLCQAEDCLCQAEERRWD